MIEKDTYPLTYINTVLSSLDFKDDYWHIPLHEESKPLTVLTVPGRGLFQFMVLPFGLYTNASIFQCLLNCIIGLKMEQ